MGTFREKCSYKRRIQLHGLEINQENFEGLQAARARGRNGGRPPKDESKIKLALSMYDSKVCSISQILETTGISKTTLYRYIRQKRGT